MRNSVQLEREAEQVRNEIARTLDELRARMTPEQLVNDAVAYARNSGAGELVRNLGHQARDNPLALCLMGAGFAWMALSNSRTASRLGATAQRGGETAQATSGGVGDWAVDALNKAADAARSATRRMHDTAEAARSALDAGSKSAEKARSLIDLCTDQPLLLAGVGLAIGAAIGAILPPTQTEDRLMGAASDELKDHLKEVDRGQHEEGEKTVERAADAAGLVARQQGPIAGDGEKEVRANEATLAPQSELACLS